MYASGHWMSWFGKTAQKPDIMQQTNTLKIAVLQQLAKFIMFINNKQPNYNSITDVVVTTAANSQLPLTKLYLCKITFFIISHTEPVKHKRQQRRKSAQASAKLSTRYGGGI